MVARGWPVDCWRRVLGLRLLVRELLQVRGLRLLEQTLLQMQQLWSLWAALWPKIRPLLRRCRRPVAQPPQLQQQCFPQPIWQATQRECRPDESP
jgi:hypothetical protein